MIQWTYTQDDEPGIQDEKCWQFILLNLLQYYYTEPPFVDLCVPLT